MIKKKGRFVIYFFRMTTLWQSSVQSAESDFTRQSMAGQKMHLPLHFAEITQVADTPPQKKKIYNELVHTVKTN